MQVEAIRVVLDTDDNVLLTGATASGKTEAAFLPILTQLDAQPPTSIGVLYIGPLKALINDQFYRLEELLEYADVPVWPWHGDVSASVKSRALKERRGIMQITPESLEGFFLYRSKLLQPLFSDLRYVVIDEVHAFMASDRGRQLICQLTRLQRLLAISPRRIGLSATLGDYSLASEWLAGGTSRPVKIIENPAAKKKLAVSFEHAISRKVDKGSTAAVRDNSSPNMESGDPAALPESNLASMYRRCRQGKTLVFVTSRSRAEEVGAGLRTAAEAAGEPDIFYIHHGSISRDYRLGAEKAMREPGTPACTVATATLELGIDLGELERVVQVGPPPSVSSFAQRLGRTGRRGTNGELAMYTAEAEPPDNAHVLAKMPWDLLQTLASALLYFGERWVEPIRPPRLPFSLLYHQTMVTLMFHGEQTPTALADLVLTLPPFNAVTREAYKRLLDHLMSIDHLQWTETGTLLVGLAAEPIVNSWRFLATFEDPAEFTVQAGSKNIGTLQLSPPLNAVFRLAGRTWRVDEIDQKRRIIFVTGVLGSPKTYWMGNGAPIHTRVLTRIRELLVEATDYAFLNDTARLRLTEARRIAQGAGILEKNILATSDGNSYLIPWLGTRACDALQLMLKTVADHMPTSGLPPFYLHVGASTTDVATALGRDYTTGELRAQLADAPLPENAKYDSFIPQDLLMEAHLVDGIDLAEANEAKRSFLS